MAQSWSSCCWQLTLASFLIMSGAISSCGDRAFAQITPDGNLPNNSTVTSEGDTNLIQGGTQAGTNLFHSFTQFSVPTGNTAYFNNLPTIENIFSRVTGGSTSNIDGVIKANGTANLFLLNPNGVIFGPNARLNIGGSFLASTASSLKFADGNEFSAKEFPTTPLLTVSIPIGLQFGENAGRIIVQGQGQGIRENSELIDTPVGLRVQPNQTLALVGGDIALEGGTLKTAGGRIELGSVAGSSLVSLASIDKGWSLGYEGVQNFRDIQLSQAAAVDASGAGGGDIQVQGRRVTLRDGSQMEASTLRSEPGGTLSINASDSVELIGQSATTQIPTYLVTIVYPEATGTGGNISLRTGRLIVRDGALVNTGTVGQGKGGNLTLTASDYVELSGTGTSPEGKVVPSGLYTQTEGTGDATDLTIITGRLSIRDGAVVSASTLLGAGKGGNLSVTASDSVEVVGSSALTTQTQSAGAAGELTLSTGQLSIRDGAFVSASTFGAGKGGNLSVTASDSVEVTGSRSGLFVSSRGSGDAGNLQLTARSTRLDNQGKINAETTSGQGGDIKLQVQDLLLLRRGSNISTSAGITGASGNGGNINIDTDLLAVFENSNITANAVVGRGGNVRISTQGLFLSPDSKITAKSERGIDGVVEINRADIDPSAELVVLPAELVDVSGLIAQGCPAGGSSVASGESKFIVTGRGGLPPTPRDTLSSETVLEDWGNFALASTQPVRSQQRQKNQSPSPADSTLHTHLAPDPIVEAQGWVIGDNGNVVLTANASTDTSHRPWLNPAACHGD
jgi:filamentous hemagglutinin family protein